MPLNLVLYHSENNFVLKIGFFISELPLTPADSIEYLGIEIKNNFDFDQSSINKFKKVQKSIFSLSFIGLKPFGISPLLQSFIYKTFCLSQFTYGIESITLQSSTRDYLNTSQNNLIRQIVGLRKQCHMSNVLKSLKIFNFNQLYLSLKLSFLNSIKCNEISLYIFKNLILNKKRTIKHTNSFKNDIKFLENYLKTEIETIFADPTHFKIKLKHETFNEENGIVDSITTCFLNYKNSEYRKFLNNIINPYFLKDDINSLTKIFHSILIRIETNE